ncbi:MAG: DUF4177 domain-containing protein [Oscillospiraceae bacterium]|jgi:hypothetical protein|nr:DUF4177 domain-containing protein [Oscillospiraceae bacterium]
MLEYKSEVVTMPVSFFSSKPKPESLAEFDKLLDERSSEGWELVSYSHLVDVNAGAKNSILLTFKKEKR